MSEKYIRTVFLLTQADRKTLDKISAETGAPIAFLLRRAVEEYLERAKEKK